MSPVGAENIDQFLGFMRKAMSMMAVEAMQMSSVKSGTARMSLKDIDSEIQKDRKGRLR
jgi:hypothetical protein